MKNPWEKIPHTKPFVLNEDKDEIINFNNKNKEAYQLHTELLPEPFLGNPHAKIILLNLNPGYDKKDILFHNGNHYFVEICKENLIHSLKDYPFYLLNPKISDSPGNMWWNKKLKKLIDKFGVKEVSEKICCIEFFPYHSKNFKKLPLTLKSQEYNFFLVKEAINRGALIIIMRSKRLWLNFVPELKTYNYYSLNNPRNVSISEKNLNIFGELCRFFI